MKWFSLNKWSMEGLLKKGSSMSVAGEEDREEAEDMEEVEDREEEDGELPA